MRATTIDEVLERLRAIIDDCTASGSTLGYFAALYHRVTFEVKRKIAAGYFDDGERMARLDVHFANRYLDAYDAYREGRDVTRVWRYAFDAADRGHLIVLQHLFLGMNAHINLDLGIAAAETASADTINALENDFRKINRILVDLIDEVQIQLASIWPLLSLLDQFALRTDEKLAAFSMEKARDAAWDNALKLSRLTEPQRTMFIDSLDRRVIAYADLVARPGPIATIVFLLVRLGELGNVSKKIMVLDDTGHLTAD